jgi:hypothetical protein
MSEYQGELLAIREFNAAHPDRKIAKIPLVRIHRLRWETRDAVRYSATGALVAISAHPRRMPGLQIASRSPSRIMAPGVPDKDLGLIFEPFYREARDHCSAGGEDLGLAISARAARGARVSRGAGPVAAAPLASGRS